MSKEFSFKINDIEIKSSSIYEIVPKKDDDAPEHLRKHGTSKLLLSGVTDGAPCRFDEVSGIWDTGFHENSPCYRGWKDQDKQNLIKVLRENIVQPIEELKGEGILSHLDKKDSFWLTFGMASLKNGRLLNTSNPLHLLELYIMAHTKKVAPKGDQENNPMYLSARYSIINKEKSVSVREERKLKKAEAINSFFNLKTTDKNKLEEVLNYLGFRSTSEEAITSVVMDYIENPKEGHNNAVRLLDTIKKANSDSGYKEINTFTQLSDLFKKGVIKKVSSEYFLGDKSLGMDLKSASIKVSKTAELKKRLREEMLKTEA